MAEYKSVDVKCPFYKKSDNNQIICEGMTDDSTIHMCFSCTKSKNNHSKVFCENHYDKCEIYRAVMESKYNEG